VNGTRKELQARKAVHLKDSSALCLRFLRLQAIQGGARLCLRLYFPDASWGTTTRTRGPRRPLG